MASAFAGSAFAIVVRKVLLSRQLSVIMLKSLYAWLVHLLGLHLRSLYARYCQAANRQL